MKIQIIGPPCFRFTELAKATEAAVQALSLYCEIDNITDPAEIEKYGIPLTPVLIVDGEVRSMGRVLSQQALKALLKFIAAHSSEA